MARSILEGTREAKALRDRLQIGRVGPIDVDWVARKLDVVVVRRPLSALSGIHLAHASGRSFIAVNSGDIATRQNFTLAHEIAHHVFDRNDTIAEKVEVGDTSPTEMRANAFAAELLLPTEAIRQWQRTPHLKMTADEIARLALNHRMSFLATLYRLKTLGIIVDVAELYDARGLISPTLRHLLNNRTGEARSALPENFLRMADEALERHIISRKRHHEITATNAIEEDF